MSGNDVVTLDNDEVIPPGVLIQKYRPPVLWLDIPPPVLDDSRRYLVGETEKFPLVRAPPRKLVQS